MKITTEIPVIVYENGWYETKGTIEIEWCPETYNPQEEKTSPSVVNGIKNIREQIEEALEMMRSDGKLLNLKKLVKLIEKKQDELNNVERELKKRKRKLQTLDSVLRQFGIEPEHYGVVMNLEKVAPAPAIEAEATKIEEDEENQIPFNDDDDDDDE